MYVDSSTGTAVTETPTVAAEPVVAETVEVESAAPAPALEPEVPDAEITPSTGEPEEKVEEAVAESTEEATETTERRREDESRWEKGNNVRGDARPIRCFEGSGSIRGQAQVSIRALLRAHSSWVRPGA